MDENERVSIITPAYNAEKTIRETIESVIKQTYPYWEMIIIDDCSSDATMSIIKDYAARDGRIIVISNTRNCGVSDARNRGVNHARGKWVAFLDSDDMWAADKLWRQIELLHNKKSKGESPDIIFTGSGFIDSSGRTLSYKLDVPKTISYHELLKQNVISCSSVLVRRKLVLMYPMKHDDMHEDYAVWLQILKNGGHAYGINEPLLIYRLSETSKSGNKKKAALMTLKVYRYIGLNPIQSFYYFSWYAYRNLRKYYTINHSRTAHTAAENIGVQ